MQRSDALRAEDAQSLGAVTGRVVSVETFGSVDGPGIRFVAFLAGCPLRCLYCHNPETWGVHGGIERTAGDLLKQALRYRPYWKRGGGITVSGGEPMAQAPFVTALFRLAKAQGVSTCLDTSGAPFTREESGLAAFRGLLDVTDLVLLDLKHITSARHEALTGKPNEAILDFARYLAEIQKPAWIRHVLVPGYNDDAMSLQLLSRFIAGLGNIERVEVLPYHRMAVKKYAELGLPYRLGDTPEPDEESVRRAEEILRAADYQKYKT